MHASARKWEARRVGRPEAPPPPEARAEIDYAFLAAGQYGRCADAAAELLRAEPLDVSRFHLYAFCLKKAGRFEEAERLAEEVPALRGTRMYRYYAAQRVRREKLRRPLEELQDEQFSRDMTRVALAASRKGIPLVLSSYPEEEYAPVRRTAEKGGLPYADMLRCSGRA